MLPWGDSTKYSSSVSSNRPIVVYIAAAAAGVSVDKEAVRGIINESQLSLVVAMWQQTPPLSPLSGVSSRI